MKGMISKCECLALISINEAGCCFDCGRHLEPIALFNYYISRESQLIIQIKNIYPSGYLIVIGKDKYEYMISTQQLHDRFVNISDTCANDLWSISFNLAKIEKKLDKCRTSSFIDGWQTQRHAKKARKWDYYAEEKRKLKDEFHNKLIGILF